MKSLPARLWDTWKELGRYIGDFQSRLLLTVFYFTVLAPFGLLSRLIADPLRIHTRLATSNWTRRGKVDEDLASARRQF